MASSPLNPRSTLPKAASALLWIGAAFIGGTLAGAQVVHEATAAGGDPYAGLDTLARVLGTIESRYVEDVDVETLAEGATRGLVQQLDPWSVYMSPTEWSSLQEHADGLVPGVGIEIARDDDGTVRLTAVTAGGPADQAGLSAGDALRAVDGVAVEGEPLAAVQRRLEGPRGSTVQLTIAADGAPQTVALVRDLTIERVVQGRAEGDRWVVQIHSFSRSAATQLDAELRRLGGPRGVAPTGLVLDLRGNPGGLMEQAAAVVDRFVGAGLIVESRGRGGEILQRLESHDDESDIDWPMVVLVDEGSASAAEVVAGALRARGRAELVGRPTYGKGTVQHVFELEDGSALKLTLARYHLPDGRSLADREGLMPDLVVAAPSPGLAPLRQAIADAHLDDATEQALLETLDASSAPSEPPPGDADLEAAWTRMPAPR